MARKVIKPKLTLANRLRCAPRPEAGDLAAPEEIRAVFAEAFEMPLPAAMLPKGKLYSTGGYCYCSENNPNVIPNSFGLKKMAKGYYAIGFWDSSAHTYFSYCRTDKWRRIDFRMIYGGAYDDWKQCKEEVREYLIAYCAVEEQLQARVRTLHLVVDISGGNCSVVWNDGRKQKLGNQSTV